MESRYLNISQMRRMWNSKIFFVLVVCGYVSGVLCVDSLGALNIMNAGLEYGWTSASFPILLKAKDNQSEAMVTSEEGVWIATLPLPGAVLGALASAFICDYVGRKKLILFASFPYTIHWLLIAFAQSAHVFYIARALAGMASGMALTAMPMYTGEISNPKHRGLLCGTAPLCITSGVFLINLLQLFLSIRAAALTVIVFSVTSFLGLVFMPDSPYFLLMKNKEAKALRSLQMFRGREDVDVDFNRIKGAVEEQKGKKKEGVKPLFSIAVNRKSLYIIVTLRAAQPLCGITTLVYYCSVIFLEAGADMSVQYSTLVFSVSLMVSVIIGLILIDHLGRRFLILFSLTGSFLGLLTLGIYFHLKFSNVSVMKFVYVPLVAMVWTVFFYGVGLQQIPYVMQGELFSTGVKSSAVAVALIVFCIFSMLCSKYFQYINDNIGAYIAFYTFAAFNLSTFILVLFFVPETKGITLEDVQLMIKQKKLNFKNVDTNN